MKYFFFFESTNYYYFISWYLTRAFLFLSGFHYLEIHYHDNSFKQIADVEVGIVVGNHGNWKNQY